MRLNLQSRRVLLILAAAVGFLNILPLIIFPPQGDVVLSYVLIQCFGEQVWTGHWYPRWCMSANAGYGSPVPIFYFPVSFYITAIFFPLRFIGVEIMQIYLIGLWLLAAITFLTTFHWLKYYTLPGKAAICAFIFLFITYRLELVYFRTSYAEAWAMGLMPLLFIQIRKLINNEKSNWAALAFLIAFLLLTHASATIIGLMAAGLLVLALNPKKIIPLAIAFIFGFLSTWFHWHAAEMWLDTLHPLIGGVLHWKAGWVNNYADQIFNDTVSFFAKWDLDNFNKLADISVPSTVALFLFAIWFCMQRKLKESPHCKEARTWLFIMFFALFMMISYSDIIWTIIERLAQIRTPWRMAMLIAFGFIALLAMASKLVWESLSRFKKHIAVFLLSMLILSGILLVNYKENLEKDRLDVVIYTQNILSYFNTKWTDIKYIAETRKEFYGNFVFNPPANKAHFTDGEGKAEISQWLYEGIHIHTERKKPGSLLVEHLYNPIWRATVNGILAELAPEKDEFGRMLVEVPAGTSDIELSIDATPPDASRYHIFCTISLISFLIIVASYFSLRFLNNRRQQ
jgi:hypothetical protein